MRKGLMHEIRLDMTAEGAAEKFAKICAGLVKDGIQFKAYEEFEESRENYVIDCTGAF